MTDYVGRQFGDYHLTRFLGSGTFGDVYEGRHIHDNTLAAVKVLHTRLTNNDDLKEFINEARTFRLKHPNIVQILDFGIGDNDTPFLIMEFAPNGTLRQRHPRGTLLPLTIIISYIKQIAAALQYAHDRKLIHRDVKPDNILVGSKNEILVSDFGIAVAAHSTHSLDTQNQAGTVPYMAPEQIQGKPRPASDQYALGVIVYEWLCGERPFNGTAIEIAMQHALAPPPSLLAKLPTLSTEVVRVVMKALAKEPKERFVNIVEFAQALEQAGLPKGPTLGVLHTVYRNHTGMVRAVEWSPNGKYIASGGGDWDIIYSPNHAKVGTIDIWDAITGSTIFVRTGASFGPVSAVVWSPHDTLLASGGGLEDVSIWNATTGNSVFTYRIDLSRIEDVVVPENVVTLAWSPNGRYIACASSASIVHILDITTQRSIASCGHYDDDYYYHYPHSVDRVTWSPDGRYIAQSKGNNIFIWEIKVLSPDKGIKVLDKPLLYEGKGGDAVWSPHGPLIATSQRGLVNVWDIITGDHHLTYYIQKGTIRTNAWSPNGKCIASGSSDGKVYIWDAVEGKTIYVYQGHSDAVNSITWSPDGSRIASGSSDQTIHVWQAI